MIVVRDKLELLRLINRRIDQCGPDCDLNDIDVSKIDDMSYMFYESQFNGDISNWNVSNVECMESMFFQSMFTGDISRWDLSNVEDAELEITLP